MRLSRTFSGSLFSPPVKKRGLENAVLFSFSGIISVLHAWGHLLKNGHLLIHRHKEHCIDHLKCWLSKELTIFALECGMVTVLKMF